MDFQNSTSRKWAKRATWPQACAVLQEKEKHDSDGRAMGPQADPAIVIVPEVGKNGAFMSPEGRASAGPVGRE